MIETDQVQIWNLSRGGIARSGAVDIFNVVGRLHAPGDVETFTYQLNDGPETPVCFLRPGSTSGRLDRPGDFNIDTLRLADLAPDNRLRLHIARSGKAPYSETVAFRTVPFAEPEPRFRLDLDGIGAAEEVGQIVEGPWRVGQEPGGRRFLEVAPEDAGYDRIILFGREDWTTGYEVRARLRVTRISGRHNIGLIFKWNPHQQGDGSWLPRTWSGGLAYYCSYGARPGLRLRFGVQVQRDRSGQKQGSFILAQCPLRGRLRALLTRLMGVTRLVPGATDLTLGQDYALRLRVDPARYQLTFWPADQTEPAPQLIAEQPLDRLPKGSVGILAFRVGVRLYEFEVIPPD